MDQWDTITMAKQLLDEHGLGDWSFAFNRRKRGMGLCRFDDRRIELSYYFVTRNDEVEVRDTILHEIAHALVGPKAGHGPVWKAKCAAIGARPQRTGDADMPAGRWRATCPSCRHEHSRYRKPPAGGKYFCRQCGADRGMLQWIDSTRLVPEMKPADG